MCSYTMPVSSAGAADRDVGKVKRCGTARSDVLIDQNLVSVRVYSHKAGGSLRSLIHFRDQRYAPGLQLALQITNVGEGT